MIYRVDALCHFLLSMGDNSMVNNGGQSLEPCPHGMQKIEALYPELYGGHGNIATLPDPNGWEDA